MEIEAFKFLLTEIHETKLIQLYNGQERLQLILEMLK